MSPKPEAHISLTLTLSTPTLSLSHPDEPLTIKVTATTLSSSKPAVGIIVNARWTILDDRLTAYRYPLRLRSVREPESFIPLSPAVRISGARPPVELDLRRSEMERFLVVPGMRRGGVEVEQKVTVGRIFEYSGMKPSDIQPGSEYRFEVPNGSLPPQWWTFKDEAEGKRFAEGILPDENGFHGLKADDPAEVERLYREGWLYSYPIRDCKFTVETEPGAVVRFVE
ncbi:Uu.00g023720.m01.CDS01 [Anthostomella pinea]|uniref:Uu.00g023720.m01.CDS01 n=1 Tax=Anthostomella pinea TaxID=933095 RepID=A0AAI8YR10_9PEZI|nr:Uu.00g023720.m01.CDS01 [Anthostomella pinea]